MLRIQVISILCLFHFKGIHCVRLHKIFKFIDGYDYEHNLKGYLHVGTDYGIFLRIPKPQDKYLTYELYETKNYPDAESKPRLLAITEVPLEYIKEQLKTFRMELYNAKYVDDNIIPGTQVKTVREWQIDKALKLNDNPAMKNKMPILRTLIEVEK